MTVMGRKVAFAVLALGVCWSAGVLGAGSATATPGVLGEPCTKVNLISFAPQGNLVCAGDSRTWSRMPEVQSSVGGQIGDSCPPALEYLTGIASNPWDNGQPYLAMCLNGAWAIYQA